MKYVIAIIRPEKLGAVRQALEGAGVSGIMISEIEGHGKQKGLVQQWRGEKYRLDLIPKIRLEMAVKDEDVAAIKDAVIKSARTGEIGDGKLFVLSGVEQIVRIRTGEEGETAL